MQSKLGERIAYDNEIRQLVEAGKELAEIANTLGIPKHHVSEARYRLGYVAKSSRSNAGIRYNDVELVTRRCPMCRKEHRTDPVIWTCEKCRHDDAYTAGW